MPFLRTLPRILAHLPARPSVLLLQRAWASSDRSRVATLPAVAIPEPDDELGPQPSALTPVQEVAAHVAVNQVPLGSVPAEMEARLLEGIHKAVFVFLGAFYLFVSWYVFSHEEGASDHD
jgi:hypothetical protein